MRTLRQPARKMNSMRWCIQKMDESLEMQVDQNDKPTIFRGVFCFLVTLILEAWRFFFPTGRCCSKKNTKARRFVQRALQCFSQPCALAAKWPNQPDHDWALKPVTWESHLSRNDLPSGKHTRSYGKWQSLMGKSTINGPCSIAMLNYQRVVLCLCMSIHSWNVLFLHMQADRQIDRYGHIFHTLKFLMVYPRT